MSRLRFAVTALAVAGLLAVCATAVQGGRTSGVAQAASSRAQLSGTLSFFEHDSFSNPVGEALIKQYEHLHPKVTIKIVHMPTGDELPFVEAQLAGGTAPDVMTLATNEEPWRDVSKGWWLNLTKYAQQPNPYVKGNKSWISLLQPSAASELKFANGNLYSMSTTGFDVGFIYNKAVFSALHLKPPTTWAQMISDFKKIKAAGYIPLDFELGDLSYGGQVPAFLTILEDTLMHSSIAKMDTNHNNVIDVKELIRGIKNGTYSAKNADYQEAWKLEKSLAPYFQLGPSAATGSSDGFNTFKTGRVATWFEGSFNSSSLAKTNIKWSTFVMPRITKATSRFATNGPQRVGGFGACCGYPWSIPTTTKKNGHLPLALDFINFLSTPKNTDKYAAGAGVLSILKTTHVPAQQKPFAVAAGHVSRVAVAELSLPPNFMQTRARLIGEYVTGSLSLSQAMKQMQTEMNRDAAQAIKMYGFKHL